LKRNQPVLRLHPTVHKKWDGPRRALAAYSSSLQLCGSPRGRAQPTSVRGPGQSVVLRQARSVARCYSLARCLKCAEQWNVLCQWTRAAHTPRPASSVPAQQYPHSDAVSCVSPTTRASGVRIEGETYSTPTAVISSPGAALPLRPLRRWTTTMLSSRATMPPRKLELPWMPPGSQQCPGERS